MSSKVTKKILHSTKDEKRQEFLIPASKSDGFNLVGCKSGKEYLSGIVVFTGKVLTSEMLAEKAKYLRIPIESSLYQRYLEQVPKFKISKLVEISPDNKELELKYVEKDT